ncbi:uncharacterized protein LOC100832974 [Brachypodium distachyon]|uniref:Uncharacterized protein n=1 Tax=Brachypodium distachyon TaxID=15368 RepID=I1IAN2_BRADI|nr:uncharacterized protein LOC100832974 [Brachypodium distachyon]KQJ99943.1 hypothetical protein BRADI_3g46140v3 [Brachypodium distachyon]|eukprot:XP_024317893.1 uncharacterized protein LOC100832974 [Brachypodium distachyon]
MPLLAPPLSSCHLRPPFLSFPSSTGRPLRRGDLVIRMGGGPRTFPGGVSKWQWKRMQARKAKQLLKARLARERQLYEMRKRAELREAVFHLERPWDPDSASTTALAPNLLSVAADDQLKGLADRFHRPGGVDLWNDRDGPQVFASPDTGRTSARFFPKDAVHSVQPYARLGAGVDGGQGVRQNAPVEDVRDDCEPTVELMERDGMWEPVIALDGRASSERSWINGDAISDSDSEDVDFGHEQQEAIVRRDGRRRGIVRRDVSNSMTDGSGRGRDWRAQGSFSDSEGTRKGRLDQRWPDDSSDSRRKRPAGKWKSSATTKGSNSVEKDRMVDCSFSDSEVNRGGFEPRWRARSREGTMNAEVKWKLSYDSHGNVTRKVRIGGEFDPNSDHGRCENLEPKWKGPNSFNRGENQRGRPALKYRPNAANNGERSGGYTRGNNGDVRDRFGNGFASDLEEPTWNPRIKNKARNNSGHREYNHDMNGRFREGGSGADGMNGRFRRGGSGAARRMNNDREDGSKHGSRQRIDMNGGRPFMGDGYSLRPTSELHSSMDKNGGQQLREYRFSRRST